MKTKNAQIRELKEEIERINNSKREMFVHFMTEKEKLQTKVEDSVKAVAEIGKLLDMILINLTRTCGKIEENGFSIRLPRLNVMDLDEYKVICSNDDPAEEYVIKVVEKKNEKQ